MSIPNRIAVSTASSLTALLSRTMPTWEDPPLEREFLDFVLIFGSLIGFSRIGIYPASIENSPAKSLLKRICRSMQKKTPPRLDQSDFADLMFPLANRINPPTEPNQPYRLNKLLEEASCSKKLFDEFERILAVEAHARALEDPGLCGWLYQEAVSWSSFRKAWRSSRSEEAQTALTQWFTPGWIAEFLVKSALEVNNEKKFARQIEEEKLLDPCCGAGHLLVPALYHLTARATKSNHLAREDALSDVLANRLWGFDLDPAMIELSALSLYLAARKLVPDAELPPANLFYFESTGGINPGSLSLGTVASTYNFPRDLGSLSKFSKERDCKTPLIPTDFRYQVLNPPYMSRRNMPSALAGFLRENYKESHHDLYTAFLELAVRSSGENGRISTICQRSFLHTSRFEPFRRSLLERCRIESIITLGSGAFAGLAGEKVSSTVATFERKQADGNKHLHRIKFMDLSKPVTSSFESAEVFARLRNCSGSLNSDFESLLNTIPGYKILLECETEAAALFSRYESLSCPDFGIETTNGLFTCNNKAFVKHFRDVPVEQIGLLRKGAPDTSIRYFPYDKGGGSKWYSATPYLIDWQDGGDRIREYRAARGQSRALPGERFYGSTGVTYSYIGTRGFKARLLGPGVIFDVASSAIFSGTFSPFFLLGLLNSSLMRYLLARINPTVNFQIGDLRVLPFSPPDKALEKEINNLSEQAVDLARLTEKLNPKSPDYLGPDIAPWQLELEKLSVASHSLLRGTDKLNGRISFEKNIQLDSALAWINKTEHEIQKKIDDLVFDHYGLSKPARDRINRDSAL